MRHICKMEKLEVRAVIKYFCKKGIHPKEIHEDFIETLGKESPYSTVKIWQQSLTLSLPNATVVEFTVHCQTRLQSKLKAQLIAVYFFTVIKDANLSFLFQNVQGT